jgi:Ala-tRNA(Pro) deacylase
MVMTITAKVTDYLENNYVPYEVIVHPERFTAEGTARIEHVPECEFAKVVMLKVEDRNIMMVVPANRKVDLLKVSEYFKTNAARIEEEQEFISLFPDCEVGAMPPLGKLYQVPCFVDVELIAHEQVHFNAGGHRACIRIMTSDYVRLAETELGDFCVSAKK